MIALIEYEKQFFTYEPMINELWGNLIHQSQNYFKVHFDLENNYSGKIQRIIIVPQTQWDHVKCQFKCELFMAGGDWEYPVNYFRCQLIKGYAYDLVSNKSLSRYKNSSFIFIPNKEEGNNHLIEKNGKYYSPNNNEVELKETSDDRKCWKSLNDYLVKIVQIEIEKIKNDSDDRIKSDETNP